MLWTKWYLERIQAEMQELAADKKALAEEKLSMLLKSVSIQKN